MEVIQTQEFESSFSKLPKEIQRLYLEQKKRFGLNPRDARLHLKKVIGLTDVFSFRVTRRYRVLFYFQNSERAILFEIDHRKNIYR